MAAEPGRVGARIAELRKMHGATQHGLASRANVSYSLLRKVERGERAASHGFVAAVARALTVNVTDITEQPCHAHNATRGSEQSGVPALRAALVEGDDPGDEGPCRRLDVLRGAVVAIKEADRRTKHAEAVRALPDVLRDLHRSWHHVPTNKQAETSELLAAAYSYAVVALCRLEHLDLAHLADERARVISKHGDDPIRAAVAEWNHSLLLLFDGSHSAGLRSIDRAGTLLDEHAPNFLAVSAVRGALHLRAAIIAARATNTDLAEAHLAEAARLATSEQEAFNYYGTKFGASNVDIHRVAVPVELADGCAAITRAETIHLPSATAPSRLGHYWIDLARGWLLYGDRRKTVESLQTARRIAPQLTRYHPQIREAVQTLAANDARQTGTLSTFAAWCGIRS